MDSLNSRRLREPLLVGALKISVVVIAVILLFSEIPQGLSLPTLGLSINTQTDVFTGEGTLTANPSQKLGFVAGLRHYIFFFNNTHYLYTSTLTGLTFATAKNIRIADSLSAQSQSVVYDSVNGFIHWVGLKSSVVAGQATVVYRRGTINSIDSSVINWGSEVNVDTNVFEDLPNIAVDTDGRPFISYGAYIFTPNPNGGDTKIYAIRASAIDGSTWNTKTELASIIGSESYASVIVPLNNRRMYFIYCLSGAKVKGQLWTGTQFQTEDVISASNLPESSEPSCSAVRDNSNNIHLTFTKYNKQAGTFDVVYMKRTANWGSETILATNQFVGGSNPTYPVISIDLATGITYFTWFNSNSIVMARKFVNNTVVIGTMLTVTRALGHGAQTIGIFPTTNTLGIVKVIGLYWLEADQHLVMGTMKIVS